MKKTLDQTHPELESEWSPKNEVEFHQCTYGSKRKAIWVCSASHEYEATICNRTLSGSGCPYCAGHTVLPGFNDLNTLYPELGKRISPHSEYSAQEVTSYSSKSVLWKCERQHEFNAKVSSVVKGTWCPYCSGNKVLPGFNDLETSHPELLQEMTEKTLSYRQKVSHGSSLKLMWQCTIPEHPDYSMSVKNKVYGQGCPICSGKKVHSTTNVLNLYPQLQREYHSKNDKNLSSYTIGSHAKVWWQCSQKHEWVSTIKDRTIQSQGCPVCSGNKVLPGFNDLSTTHPELAKEWSVQNAQKPTEVSQGSNKKVWWQCNQGHTYQTHISGRAGRNYGCPKCSNKISQVEQDLAKWVKEHAALEVITNSRQIISPFELDIYIPKLKFAIEFNGLYWHSEKLNQNNKTKHHDKWKLCNEKGIQLLQIWEDDWRDKQEIVKKMLAHKLQISQEPKLNARDSSVKNLEMREAKKFLEQTHIQGFVNSTVYLGLVHQNETVAVMSFRKQQDKYYLTRYSTKGIVRGGFQKLLAYFENNYHYTQLITFADLTLSNGALYEDTGWQREAVLSPDYSYLNKNKREHKLKYRKIKFKNDPTLEFDSTLTEKELAELNNLYRIWDAGKIKYVKYPA